MNTYQIDKILKRELGDIFLGVFARDQLPRGRLPRKWAMVVNTHPSTRPGEHWVAFYVEDNVCEYFDSYGLPPPLDFEHYMKQRGLTYVFNNCLLQDYFSFVCGQYCIYYLYHRNKGESMTSILTKLKERGDKNDSIVSDFVARKWEIDNVCRGQICKCMRDFMYA